MRIGYACLTAGVPDTDLKSCSLKNISETKLVELIGHNLLSLEKIIDYNSANRIRLFRISSDLIPFGSSPANPLLWEGIFSARLQQIGQKIKNNRLRVSMHPGQYTVLNSSDAGVVSRAMADLDYHARVLDSLGTDDEHKIVLHIGGVYNDKKQAVSRFISHFEQLGQAIKRRLVLENDDRSYNIEEVLEIAARLGAPAIFDNLHHAINPPTRKMSDVYWIGQCRATWLPDDGRQKIHYSQQNPLKKPGSHSDTIYISEFMNFYDSVAREDLDIMLEVKDKNLSALKCINCISPNQSIKVLEQEWSKYKY
ncbi:MAG: UV-endonuclease UvdE, partial [Firmicutes bacterium]|nr:UV-endonuclease UvdE [Bacillota bacterium]